MIASSVIVRMLSWVAVPLGFILRCHTNDKLRGDQDTLYIQFIVDLLGNQRLKFLTPYISVQFIHYLGRYQRLASSTAIINAMGLESLFVTQFTQLPKATNIFGVNQAVYQSKGYPQSLLQQPPCDCHRYRQSKEIRHAIPMQQSRLIVFRCDTCLLLRLQLQVVAQ